MKTNLRICILVLFGGLSSVASSLEITNNDWTFSLNGNVNGHYIYSNCDGKPGTVNGGVFLCTGEDASTVGNGFLPSSFDFGTKTNRGGYDVSAHLAYEAGLDFNRAFNAGGDGEGLRAWLALEKDTFGKLLVGRNYGVYGIDVILEDMVLTGVGGTAAVKSPINTQLGGAGYGYIFTDRITQITYTVPTSDQWATQIGVFQPFDVSEFSFGEVSTTNVDSGSEAPGFHGRVRRNFKQGFVSSTFLTQQVNNATANIDDTSFVYDITGKVTLGKASFVASYFNAKGLGHTGLLIDSHDPSGVARDSDGYFVQASYVAGKNKIGINYGISNLEATDSDDATLLKENEKITLGLYRTLESGLLLSTEISDITATSQANEEISNNVFNVGLSFFF